MTADMNLWDEAAIVEAAATGALDLALYAEKRISSQSPISEKVKE